MPIMLIEHRPLIPHPQDVPRGRKKRRPIRPWDVAESEMHVQEASRFPNCKVAGTMDEEDSTTSHALETPPIMIGQ